MSGKQKSEFKNVQAAKTVTAEVITERVQKLLDLVRVKRVYYIDDALRKDVDVEVFLGKIRFIYQGGNVEDRLKDIAIEDVEFSEPIEVVSETIKEKWGELQADRKLELLKELNKVLEDKQALLDDAVTPKVREYFPDGMLYYVDPNEWEAMLGNLNEEINEEDKVLLIFDQNLEGAGGKYLTQTGIDLIIQLKETALKDRAICALLTHEISLTEQELYYREQLKDKYENQISYLDFFPLSKQRLYEPEVFADGIKKTLINRHFEFIKDETIKVIREAQDKSLEKVKKLDTYDFDEAIIRTSAREGVWEIETLLRITEIIHKDELHQAILASNYPEKVNPEIKESLRFNDVQFTIPEDYKPYSEKDKLRHKELYQSGELINKLHKPIENGDIFELHGQKFILVAQPCDLMVRGKEPRQGKRNAKYVTLLKIDNILVADFVKKVKRPDSLTHFLADKHALDHLYEQPNDMGIVMFNESITVDVDLLDIIVYNEDGKCVFSFPNNSFETNLYNTAWEKRFGYIKEKIDRIKSNVDEAFHVIKDEIPERETFIKMNFYPKLVVNTTFDGQFDVSYFEGNTFDFGIKRIANYKAFNAAYLLERYTRHQSRTAELHDFSRKP